jgi:NodT family efflux transporter outer membrane factor (OMF) lipoprotein
MSRAAGGFACRRPSARLVLLLASAFLITSCSVGPKYHAPAVPAPPAYKEANPDTYKETGNWKPAQPSDAKLRGDWWTLFNDPELNTLEQQIDVSNQNLKAAQARFQQARALIRFNRSGLFPTLSIGADVTANRGSASATLTNPAVQANYGNFALPLEFNWELDAWGRIRHQIEAAREEAQATAADLETIRLSLHSELAYDYFELRSLDAEQKLLDDTVVAYRKALDLTRNRFEGGAASGAEVAQAETQLQTTLAQDQDIGVQRAQYEHAIAALVGKAPAEFTLPPQPLNIAPPQIPAGVPSQLLERRPDIAAAERRVAEANAQIGIARAAYFPTVLLSAAVGLQGSSITNWFNWPSRFWAVGPTVLQTLFDAGRRRAENEAARAEYDAQVATYRQTALDAFQQVEDNLAALRILSQEAETQHAAVAAAQRSLDLSMNRYTGGLVTYLEVVTAQSTALADERTEVDILRRRMDASVLLVKALGGGWDRSQLPALTKG